MEVEVKNEWELKENRVCSHLQEISNLGETANETHWLPTKLDRWTDVGLGAKA